MGELTDFIIEMLSSKLSSHSLLYSGWPSDDKVKELRRSRGLSESFDIPEVSITEYEYWPEHLDINVWTKTRHERNDISNSVMAILKEAGNEHRIAITHVEEQDITFEEEGTLRPGKWDVIKGSKPTFRKLIQVNLRN